MKKGILLFVLMLFLFSSEAVAQLKISGKVTDAVTGEALPAASVIIGGTTSGTMTDPGGNFSLTISSGNKELQVRFLGYLTKTVKIGGEGFMTIALEPETKEIEGVIVTAIGIKADKKSIGYAAQQVEGNDLVKAKTSNIVNALGSKVAGMEVISSSGTPGASSSITIRGRSSLRASGNSPLFVVDGVPIDNSYSGSYYLDYSNRAIDLNSDDVESVSVLKGAAATALYGIRAANGAILITTKSGKSATGVKTNITFRTTMGIDEVNKLPERQALFAQGAGGIYSSTSNLSWGPRVDTLRYDGSPNYAFDKNGQIVGKSNPSASDKLVNVYPVNNFFETAITSNTYLSMSGNNQSGSYFFSAGHLNQSGIVPLSKFIRSTFKISGDTKLSEKLKVSGTATYSNSDNALTQKGSNLSAVMVGLMRNTTTFDITNGLRNPVKDASSYMFPDGTQRNYYRNYDNPYWTVNKNRANAKVERLIGSSQADYTLLKWLKAMYRIGIDTYTEKRESYFDNNSSDTPNGYVTANSYQFRSINSDFVVSADKQLTEDLRLDVVAGHNLLTRTTYSLSERGDSLILPNFYDLSNTAITSGDDYETLYKIVGIYYDVKFSYKNFLYFNTTGRNDWSSTLAKGNNSFFYPSVNFSLIFSELLGLNKGSFLNYGKLRASWAEVGNDAPIYSLDNYFTAIQGGVAGQTTFATRRTIGNKNLKPETTRSTEIGTDLRFLNNRLGLDLAYYRSKSIGQIVSVPVAYASGYDHIILNAGIISNNGFEAQLTASPVEGKGFNWDVLINFTQNKNMVEDLPEGVPLLDFETTGVSSTRSVAIKGQPYGVLYGSRFLRNNEGKVLVGNNGYPLVDVLPGIVGDPNPDFLMGIRNTFSYKGLELTFLIDVRQGGDVYNGTKNVMNSLGTGKQTENREEDFVFQGINANTGQPNTVKVKRNQAYYSAQGGLAGLSEAATEDGSFIRLRELALTWSLPSAWLNKGPVKSIQTGISSRNLFLWTKYSGIDPETNLSGVSNSLGRDYFNMPNTRSLEFSLQVTF